MKQLPIPGVKPPVKPPAVPAPFAHLRNIMHEVAGRLNKHIPDDWEGYLATLPRAQRRQAQVLGEAFREYAMASARMTLAETIAELGELIAQDQPNDLQAQVTDSIRETGAIAGKALVDSVVHEMDEVVHGPPTITDATVHVGRQSTDEARSA